MTRVIVIMGVSGSGKSTIGERIAAAFGWMFQEGDKLHSAANVAKMASGQALTDADREPWLDAIAEWIDARLATNSNGVITCSALKRAYRERIGNGKPGVQFVFLAGDYATLSSHVQGRRHEYMPPSLLDSQLATLEVPQPDENVIKIDTSDSIDKTVAAVINRLAL